MINQQSAASNTHSFFSYVPTRPLALDRQTTTATESETTATRKRAIRTPPILLHESFRGKKSLNKRCDTGTNACHWFLPWMLYIPTNDLLVTRASTIEVAFFA